MYDVLLSNATVITMDERRRVLDNGAVGIENGRIAFVGTNEEAESLEVKEAGHIRLGFRQASYLFRH